MFEGINAGYMLRGTCLNETELPKLLGQKITEATITDEELRLTFSDGRKVRVWDNGQDCCEHRYMSTDDDVNDLVGHGLLGITVKKAETVDDDRENYRDVHEVCFVEVATDGGSITLVNHNEHNGYYGGFSLVVSEV